MNNEIKLITLKRTCLVKERDMMTDVWGEEDKPGQWQEVLKPKDI